MPFQGCVPDVLLPVEQDPLVGHPDDIGVGDTDLWAVREADFLVGYFFGLDPRPQVLGGRLTGAAEAGDCGKFFLDFVAD